MARPSLPRLAAAGAVASVAVALGLYALRPSPTASKPDPEDDPVRPPAITFTDVTAAAGLRFRHTSGAAGNKLLPETMGSGVAVLDYDRDDRPDLFFVNSRPWPGQPGTATQALYRNRGDGTFEEVTAAAGLAVELYGQGVTAADLDDDGWPDLFVTAVGGNRLFRNVGGKRFDDVTTAAGFPVPVWPGGSYADFLRRDEPLSFPSSTTVVDYDGDGRLDLFVCNYVQWSPARDVGVPATLSTGVRAYVPPQQFGGTQCELWRNLGGGRFADVSAAAGVRVTDPRGPDAVPTAVGKALGVVACDPDGDGRPDLVVANDTVRNYFFHNRPGPSGGRVYAEVGLSSGIAYADSRPRGGMGIDAAEVSPDGPAVVVANFSNEPNSLFRLVARHPPRFLDVAPEVGLVGPSRPPMKFGAVFLDADNDGRLDLFTCNGHLEPDIAAARPGQTYPQPGQLFWNSGRPDKLLVPAGDGFPPLVGRGCAYLDYDADGDLDLVVTENNGPARLLRNDTAGGRSVRLTLTGTATGTNRDAVGAAVEVHAGGAVQRREVAAARGYLSQSELTVTVGLGPAAAEVVSVRWPGGEVQQWRNLPPGRHRLTQGEPAARPVP